MRVNERLFRSRDDRMVAGVAGGLAEIWDLDPSLVRIVWAVLAIVTGGLAFLVYIVMAIVVPEDEPAPWAAGPAAGATLEGQGGTSGPAPGSGAPTSGEPPHAASAGHAPMWAAPPPSHRRAARMEARAARSATRAAARASGRRTDRIPGAMIGGLILVAVGVFFLAREWWPQIDFDWFWPVMLIAAGAILVAAAVGRSPIRPGDRE
jgi:phage shock protein C